MRLFAQNDNADNTDDDRILSDLPDILSLPADIQPIEQLAEPSVIEQQVTEPSIVEPPPTEPTTKIFTCSFSCNEQQIKQCRKCERYYCIWHSHRYTPNMCQNCFQLLSLTLDKFTRTFDKLDMNGNLRIVREQHEHWHMDGPDWPFLNLWIHDLKDEELQELWMFHFFVMKTIEVENDVRKVKHTRTPGSMPLPKTNTMRTSTSQTTKTTRIVSAESIRKQLNKSGITDPAVIDMMIKAAGF